MAKVRYKGSSLTLDSLCAVKSVIAIIRTADNATAVRRRTGELNKLVSAFDHLDRKYRHHRVVRTGGWTSLAMRSRKRKKA
ncbi:MAG TPA: hypothetical protein VHK27_03920, partial [Gammaproteobacteria bacterium]|nr:hypothetical protein [Gammaproteobacteria bacterium]